MKLVSVLMSVYNGEKYLRDSIESVLDQSFRDFEFIIVNDGSTDNTDKLLEHYESQDDRIILFHRKHNGLVKSLNFGLEKCKGDLIARIDADDVWLPDKLLLQVNRFRKDEKLYMLGTAKRDMSKNGEIIIDTKYPEIYNYHDIYKAITKKNLFCHSSVMFKKVVLDEIGNYNEEFVNSEDYEFWIRIIAKEKVEILEQPLVYYRLSPETITYRRKKEQIYYAIKAKMLGIELMRKTWLDLLYQWRDIIYLFTPNFLIRFRRKVLKIRI